MRAKTEEELVHYLLDNGKRLSCGCLISHLATNAKGYVPVSVGGRKGRKVRAHRFIYEQLFGELLPTELVLHDCDRRNCIEPSHLFIGSAAENSEDMVNKGRSRNQTTAKREGYVT